MSSIPTATANLVSRLQARGGLTGVQVAYGPPFPSPQRELIYVGNAEGDQTLLAMGQGSESKQEMYNLEVVISVLREGTDSPAADTRCFQLMSELEAEVRADPQGLSVLKEVYINHFRLERLMAADETNRESRLTVQLNCTAYI